jgi:phosphonatase-like hydrolase
MLIDLVVFDVAGTTVCDSGSVAAALRAAVREIGVEVGIEDAERVMGLAKPIALRMLLGDTFGDEALERAHRAFKHHMLEHYVRSPSVRPVEGADETFQTLREMGVRTALDTGFDRSILDAVLKRLGWDEAIDVTVASDEVDAGRPSPDMIRRAMELTGVRDAARVAKVGDTPADILEGRAAGCAAVVGVLTGTGRSSELEAAGATHVVPSVTFVPSMLR